MQLLESSSLNVAYKWQRLNRVCNIERSTMPGFVFQQSPEPIRADIFVAHLSDNLVVQ